MSLYAIDGTWNDERDGEIEAQTNVLDFAKAYSGIGIFYKRGVGTKLGFFGRLFGGLAGAGGRSRLKDAYEDICTEYIAGDTDIVIMGFSRGAALALDLANRLAEKGIVHPKTKQVVDAAPPIQFLGLFDVVASFGLPGNDINIGHTLTLPANVRRCCHAMALDERRRLFPVTRVKGAYEVWFRGGHGDVGGGNGNHPRNNISLRWMLRKAKAAGVPIDEAKVPADTDVDPFAPLRAKFSPVPEYRACADGDRVHFTVLMFASAEARPVPAAAVCETAAGESLFG